MAKKSVVTPERIYLHKLARFSPIRDLTPATLARQIDDFAAGYLREFAMTMEAVERRDDIIQSVAPKRRASISRLPYEIILDPNAPPEEAEAHKQVLEYFYGNLKATNAIDLNQKRGFSLLVEQMLHAVGFRYAVHEILWRPSPEGLTAEFNYVPLWFFENITGKLRFLPSDYAWHGEDLRENGWMVTVGPGIMEACTVAYMFKHLPLKDWLLYCEKHGMPGIIGKTDAPKDSPEWEAMKEAVDSVGVDFTAVTGREDTIDAVDFSQQGELPYPGIVDRMDRAMSALWRGADLSTMSAGQGSGEGASLQGDETDMLEEDDARLISETLQIQVDPLVIAWHFGPGTKPLAWVEIKPPRKQDVDADLKVDTFLRDSGCPLSVRETMERYSRTMPDGDEAILTKPAAAPGLGELDTGFPGASGAPSSPPRGSLFANERAALVTDRELLDATIRASRPETARALAPMVDQMDQISALQNDAAFATALRRFYRNLPETLVEINREPENALSIEAAMAAGLFNGMAEELAATGRQ